MLKNLNHQDQDQDKSRETKEKDGVQDQETEMTGPQGQDPDQLEGVTLQGRRREEG